MSCKISASPTTHLLGKFYRSQTCLFLLLLTSDRVQNSSQVVLETAGKYCLASSCHVIKAAKSGVLIWNVQCPCRGLVFLRKSRYGIRDILKSIIYHHLYNQFPSFCHIDGCCLQHCVYSLCRISGPSSYLNWGLTSP